MKHHEVSRERQFGCKHLSLKELHSTKLHSQEGIKSHLKFLVQTFQVLTYITDLLHTMFSHKKS